LTILRFKTTHHVHLYGDHYLITRITVMGIKSVCKY
jgi:hypothetical protein